MVGAGTKLPAPWPALPPLPRTPKKLKKAMEKTLSRVKSRILGLLPICVKASGASSTWLHTASDVNCVSGKGQTPPEAVVLGPVL